jgi:molybdate transport system ATP-binding protein
VSQLRVKFEKSFANGPTIGVAFAIDIATPSITALFGPSGCGKTTILRCLAGLDRANSGSIRFGDEIWFENRTWRSPQQRAVGMLFQDYALFPHLTVHDNIAFGIVHLSRTIRKQRVASMLENLGLAALDRRYPHQLSGGQQQRVALARVLVCEPKLLLLDEPLTALDGPTKDELRPQLRAICATARIPTIIVTHDRTDATALAHRLIVIDAGRILQHGPSLDVLNRPATRDIAKIVGMDTIVHGIVEANEGGLATIAVGSTRLVAISEEAPTREVTVCIRGEDVMLFADDPPRTSARNRLIGVVTSLVVEGPMVRVTIDVGFPLVALVTRPSCEELQLRPRCRVVALIKAPAVHLTHSS